MKWKYTTEHVGGISVQQYIDRKLEEMGDKGWELVSIVMHEKHPRNSQGTRYQSATLAA